MLAQLLESRGWIEGEPTLVDILTIISKGGDQRPGDIVLAHVSNGDSNQS